MDERYTAFSLVVMSQFLRAILGAFDFLCIHGNKWSIEGLGNASPITYINYTTLCMHSG